MSTSCKKCQQAAKTYKIIKNIMKHNGLENTMLEILFTHTFQPLKEVQRESLPNHGKVRIK